jgi:CMP-N-acetylneuraminic acid synthetase
MGRRQRAAPPGGRDARRQNCPQKHPQNGKCVQFDIQFHENASCVFLSDAKLYEFAQSRTSQWERQLPGVGL